MSLCDNVCSVSEISEISNTINFRDDSVSSRKSKTVCQH